MKLKLEHKIIFLSICEDIIDLCFFQSIVQEYLLLKDKNIILKKTLEILGNFLENKFIVIGNLTDRGIISFKGTPIEIINKIKKEWFNLKKEINIGEIAWIGISKTGKIKLFSLLKDFFKKEYLNEK